MDREELIARRSALGLSQADFAERLGMSRDHYGRLERGTSPIRETVAAAVRNMRPAPLDTKPSSRDPVERIIEQALIDAGIRYATDQGGGTESRLDFRLLDYGIEIEVKRFYTARAAEQIARSPDVILVQGERAARFVAAAIRSGDLFPVMDLSPTADMRDYVQAADLCGTGKLFVFRPQPNGRPPVIVGGGDYETLERADQAARDYAREHPNTRYVAPPTRPPEPGPQF